MFSLIVTSAFYLHCKLKHLANQLHLEIFLQHKQKQFILNHLASFTATNDNSPVLAEEEYIDLFLSFM